jgi:hydrogenase-1 operon protein HyaE
MPSPLIRTLIERHGLPVLDAGTVDAFLARTTDAAEHTLLFFTGDPVQRTEAADVAVVLPQLLSAFAGRLRAAVIARSAEAALASRFRVVVLPSLVVTRAADPVGVLPRIRDWSEYLVRITACLAPDAPVLPPAARPEVRIVHTEGVPA